MYTQPVNQLHLPMGPLYVWTPCVQIGEDLLQLQTGVTGYWHLR